MHAYTHRETLELTNKSPTNCGFTICFSSIFNLLFYDFFYIHVAHMLLLLYNFRSIIDKKVIIMIKQICSVFLFETCRLLGISLLTTTTTTISDWLIKLHWYRFVRCVIVVKIEIYLIFHLNYDLVYHIWASYDRFEL